MPWGCSHPSFVPRHPKTREHHRMWPWRTMWVAWGVWCPKTEHVCGWKITEWVFHREECQARWHGNGISLKMINMHPWISLGLTELPREGVGGVPRLLHAWGRGHCLQTLAPPEERERYCCRASGCSWLLFLHYYSFIIFFSLFLHYFLFN